MSGFSEFTHKYQVSKTLRFELIPQGKTLENLTRLGMIGEDRQRSENYKKLKPVIDRIYKYFIEETLKQVNVDWQPLYNAIVLFRKDKSAANSNNLKKQQEICRKAIAAWFEGKIAKDERKDYKEFNAKQSKIFKELFGKELFTNDLLLQLPGLTLSEEEKNLLTSFDKFTTYFTGFYENRKNVFSSDDISTSIPHRLVQENFPKFLDNCDMYRNIVKTAPEIKEKLEKAAKITGLFAESKLDDILTVSFYNQLLQQEQIDRFNQLIGGIAGEPGKQKIQGLNETINLAMQQDPILAQKLKNVPHRFMPLYKQILSDRSTLSFIPEAFKNDDEVIQAVKVYKENLQSDNKLEKLRSLFAGLSMADLTRIYIASDNLTTLSHRIFGEWSLCLDSLRNWKADASEKTLSKNELKEIDRWLKNDDISIAELKEALADDTLPDKITDMLQKAIAEAESQIYKPLPKNLKTAEEKEALKTLLDAVLEVYHTIEIFAVGGDAETDAAFYVPLTEAMQAIQPIIPLYNMVRNFATQKPYSVEKFKLNFSNPTLAEGWDMNKEYDYCAVIFKRKDKYYLGILNARLRKKDKPDFSRKNTKPEEDCYQKMVYKQFDFQKQLPKCSTNTKKVKKHFSENNTDFILNDKKKFVKPLIITKEIYDLNNVLFDGKKKFQIDYLRKTNDYAGYYKALHTWIDFAKNFVASYKSTAIYDISSVLPTENYEKLNDFYGELDNLFYFIEFENIPAKVVEQYVEEGKLFLFQIYNKDFAPGATGAPNLHTIYWKALFDPANLTNVVVKLNGQAELFYRPKSGMEVIRHKVGEKLVNRTLKNGLSLTDELHNEIYLYANGKLKKELSEEAKSVLPQTVIYDVHHEIIKDRRFTTDKFFFHVPLTLNYKSEKKPVKFNSAVQEYLKENPDTYVIGIDRGERNLIYAVVISPDGKIIEQRSFNVINGFDYHNKLDQREKERIKARQAWTAVGKIKELKQGYLSLVVHEISQMMIKYRAVVVLENLNVGFKRIRGGIAEKSVYQQFEKMLINKLNYLMFKDKEGTEPGSVLNAYQLTDRFESFERMGQQTGFLFYIPAAFTSKIDPATGFVDPFRWGAVKTLEDKKEFIKGFNWLKFNKGSGNFTLRFDMKKNKAYQKKLEGFIPEWDIVIEANKQIKNDDGIPFVTGKRIGFVKEKNSNAGHYQDYLPCAMLTEALQKYDIPYEKGQDVLPVILEKGESKLIYTVFEAIRLTLQMRNSNSDTGEDYISSPVEDIEGICFDSRRADPLLPKDADANGAYHIALKGLLALEKMRSGEKMSISNSDWLNYIQEKRS